MLSNSPGILIACDNVPLSLTLGHLLGSAGIPTVLGTPSRLDVPSGCVNVSLSWKDPTTIPEVFDTGHTLRTVVLEVPQALSGDVLTETNSFIHLAKAEGTRRFVLLGTQGGSTEKVARVLEEAGMSYTTLRVDNNDFHRTATAVMHTVTDSRFSGSDHSLPIGSERV